MRVGRSEEVEEEGWEEGDKGKGSGSEGRVLEEGRWEEEGEEGLMVGIWISRWVGLVGRVLMSFTILTKGRGERESEAMGKNERASRAA